MDVLLKGGVDDAVDIIEEMPSNVVKRILKSVNKEDRNTINELFDLRNKYKKEGNPLQVIIKLLLNSINNNNNCNINKFLRRILNE